MSHPTKPWTQQSLAGLLDSGDSDAIHCFIDQLNNHAALEIELADLKLALWCPLALSCFLCGQGPLLPEHLAVRWRDSLLGICFQCRNTKDSHAALVAAAKASLDELHLWKRAHSNTAVFEMADTPSTNVVIAKLEAALAAPRKEPLC